MVPRDALWAKNRHEVNHFHTQFLVQQDINVTNEPELHPTYTPGYRVKSTTSTKASAGISG